MAKKVHKTNAMRLLDSAGVEYSVAQYPVDDEHIGGEDVAALLGQSPDQVFKTLVLVAGHASCVVCCIPASCELDLKKAAAAAGEKRLEMLPLKDLFATTGYVRGGCSPLAMKKAFPTFIDETAQLFDEIAVSAGERGEQIIIAPEDLRCAADASFADLIA